MKYTYKYISPIGNITIIYDDNSLFELYFNEEKENANYINNKVIKATIQWLDDYFEGNKSKINIPIKLIGSDFQLKVWKILSEIPYGKTISYGEIAKTIAKTKGIERMSSQAIGNAVGRNPISIIIPCHRVIGKDGNLTGYSGGIDIKRKLLEIENQKIN